MKLRAVWSVAKVMSFVLFAVLAAWSLAYWLSSKIYAGFGLHPTPYVAQLVSSVLGFFLFGCIMFVVGRFMHAKQNEFVQPLVDALRRIAKGDFSVKLDTEKWKRNQPLGTFVESINDMATELHQMERMRQEFISNVSHEIQTPLTSIGGFARALHHEKLSAEERRRYLEIIEQECGRLSKLSDNLLKLTSLESEHHPFHVRPFRLDAQLRNSILACEPQWLGKKIEVEADLAEVRIPADEDLLSQVWINLLGNSIKFTPEGGLISVRLTQSGDRAVVKVADSGSGIPAEDLEHIFERFYKADKSRNRALGGNGLGLAIVKKIVVMHGGSVAAESEPGKGTTFTVVLPLHPQA